MEKQKIKINDNSSFEEFIKQHQEGINEINTLLQEPLSDEPSVIIKQINKIEGYFSYANYLYAYSEKFLSIAQGKRLLPKCKNLSELDRKIKLEEMTVSEKKFRDIMEGIVNTINKRISWGQSVLSFERMRLEKLK